jgi:hypothetical protein
MNDEDMTECWVVLTHVTESEVVAAKLRGALPIVAYHVKGGSILIEMSGPGDDKWHTNDHQPYYRGFSAEWEEEFVKLLQGGGVGVKDGSDLYDCPFLGFQAFHPYGQGEDYLGNLDLFDRFKFKSERVTTFSVV